MLFAGSGIPVVLEYEDDALVDVLGQAAVGVRADLDRRMVRFVLKSVSGCIGVSPHLLSEAPMNVPKLLLRGVIGQAIIAAADDGSIPRQNWVVFSGTHSRAKGLAAASGRLARWCLRSAGNFTSPATVS